MHSSSGRALTQLSARGPAVADSPAVGMVWADPAETGLSPPRGPVPCDNRDLRVNTRTIGKRLATRFKLGNAGTSPGRSPWRDLGCEMTLVVTLRAGPGGA